MTSKLQIAVLFGGQSAEHEVSIESAKSVLSALNPVRYETHAIFIDRKGGWFLIEQHQAILNNPHMQPLQDLSSAIPLALQPGHQHPIFSLSNSPQHLMIDIIFPIPHGAQGEDGTLQGLLSSLNIPYVGADVLGSAIAMDKVLTKELLSTAGIPVSNWKVFHADETEHLDFDKVAQMLGSPFFVKPVKTGSSIGVSKVHHADEFQPALTSAKQYDHRILFESYIAGREIECAILGNRSPEVSLPGEIIPHHAFYSYEAKYLDPEGATLKIPAELDEQTIAAMQEMAKKAFIALRCEGMARMDFFLTPEGKLFINEANTLPGFTQISMYPKLWALSGLPYPALMDRLISLALERSAHHA